MKLNDITTLNALSSKWKMYDRYLKSAKGWGRTGVRVSLTFKDGNGQEVEVEDDGVLWTASIDAVQKAADEVKTKLMLLGVEFES